MSDKKAVSRRRRAPKGGLHIRGFYRVNLLQRDEAGVQHIVGDSGWRENQITLTGLVNYVAHAVYGSAGSSQAKHLRLGTGTAPASNATALPGDLGSGTAHSRTAAYTTATTTNGMQMILNASWFSSDNLVTGTGQPIQNIGIFATTGAVSIMAGMTYATSQLQSNQDVNATYSLNLVTA